MVESCSECVVGEAEWDHEFVIQSGDRRRHVRDRVVPVVGHRLLVEAHIRGIWLSRTVQRYHDLSLLRVVGERVQAVSVGDGDVSTSSP